MSLWGGNRFRRSYCYCGGVYISTESLMARLRASPPMVITLPSGSSVEYPRLGGARAAEHEDSTIVEQGHSGADAGLREAVDVVPLSGTQYMYQSRVGRSLCTEASGDQDGPVFEDAHSRITKALIQVRQE